jgi:O-acetyl-ADP-ribose deacetylase (regulator of RNase III)
VPLTPTQPTNPTNNTAIHAAAGPKLLEACRQVPEVAPSVRCPTGEARITRAARLQVKYVIHTVGPVYESAEASAPLLASSYRYES